MKDCMLKNIFAASLIALTLQQNAFGALARAQAFSDQITAFGSKYVTSPLLARMNQVSPGLTKVAQNNPVAATCLATAIAAGAAAQAYPANASKVAQIAAGGLIGEGSKKLADKFFDKYVSKNFTNGSHTAAISKKIVSAAVGYCITQAIAYGCAYLTGTKANPGAKLQDTTANKYFSTGMLLAYARNDIKPVLDMWS